MSDDLLPDLLDAVEQQLVSPQTKYVAKTLERLVKAGMDEEEAKNQIAICLSEEMYEVLLKKRGFDENAYREALDGLPLEPGEDEA
jgi:predicted RecB family nuclease